MHIEIRGAAERGHDGRPGVAGGRGLADDESLVDLRCSVAVVGHDAFLLVHREATDDWVLPGGRPRDGESMVACARREVREETGLQITPTRCAFVLEVISPRDQRRIVELIFLADGHGLDGLARGEPGTMPEWVALERLPQLKLRPPVAGYLPAIARPVPGQSVAAGRLGAMARRVLGRRRIGVDDRLKGRSRVVPAGLTGPREA